VISPLFVFQQGGGPQAAPPDELLPESFVNQLVSEELETAPHPLFCLEETGGRPAAVLVPFASVLNHLLPDIAEGPSVRQ